MQNGECGSGIRSPVIRVSLCGLVLALCACGSGNEGSLPGDSATVVVTMVYECSNGYDFVTRIEGDTAWAFLPEETVALRQVPSGSETRYVSDYATLRSGGEEAHLQYGADPERECVNNRRRAIWEHAKLNGVHFRAIGNEAGWQLEIERDRMVLLADYGEARYEFESPEPLTDQSSRTTTYNTTDGANQLTVTIEGRACTDTMSGESFDVTVFVSLNDRLFRGCGRALH